MKKSLLFAFLLLGFNSVTGLNYALASESTPALKKQELKDKALAKYLVGTWVADDKDDDLKIHIEQTFNADGTFTGKASFDAPVSRWDITKVITFSGKWKVEGAIAIETGEKMSLPLVPLPRIEKFRISDIRPGQHLSQNLGEGSELIYKRKK